MKNKYFTAEDSDNLVHSLGLPRPTIKSHPQEKVGVASG